MERFEQESDTILTDRGAVSGITTLLAEDPDRIREAMQVAGRSKELRRYARTKQGDDDVVKAVMSSSMRDKKAIAKIAQGAQNTRQQTGNLCVLVGANGYAKKVFYPVGAKLEDFERHDLDETFGYLISKHGGKTNKYAEKIVYKKIFGDLILFCKIDGTSVVGELTPQDFEDKFPKIVTWKRM